MFFLQLLLSVGLFTPAHAAIDEQEFNIAIDMDNISYVKSAIESGEATVDLKINARPYGPGTPIVALAGRAGALKILRYLIDHKVNLMVRTNPGETPAMLASYYNDEDGQMQPDYKQHEEGLHMLVEAGASLENEPDQYTALSYAAYQAHDRIIAYLLKQGANVNGGSYTETSKVNTPLMMSVINGNLKSTLYLLRAGANAKIKNSWGKTAHVLAKQYNKTEMLPYLACAQGLNPGESFSEKCE
jgi:ankyrin repeat protein